MKKKTKLFSIMMVALILMSVIVVSCEMEPEVQIEQLEENLSENLKGMLQKGTLDTTYMDSVYQTPAPTISGDSSDTVCSFTGHTETFFATPGHDEYDWTTPSGATLVAQGGSTSDSVTYSFSSAVVYVIRCSVKDDDEDWSDDGTFSYSLIMGSKTATPTISGNTSTTVPGSAMPYYEGFGTTYGSGRSYSWECSTATILGQGTSVSEIFSFASSGTHVIKSKVKDPSDECWSDWDTHNFTLTVSGQK